jgi:hypothetical protein
LNSSAHRNDLIIVEVNGIQVVVYSMPTPSTGAR